MPYKSKQDVLAITREQFNYAEPFTTQLNVDRSDAIDYFLGRRPSPIPGRSKHATLDVLDVVEEMRALFVEMLSSGHDVIEFRPRTQSDRVSGIGAQLYVNDQFMCRNPGITMFGDFVFDAAMYKLGVFNLEWEPRKNEAVYEFNGLSEDEATELLNSPDVIVLDLEYEDGEMGKVFNGKYRQTAESPRVKLRLVRPDHFFMHEMASDVYNPDFLTEKVGATEGDLRRMGVQQKTLEQLPYYFLNDQDTISNLNTTALTYTGMGAVQSGRDTRRFYNSFIVSDFEKKNELRLYQVRWSDNVLIDYKEVNRHYYFWWSPIRVSHKTIGLSYADTTKGVQAHSTNVRRGIMDHVIATTNRTRYANEALFVDATRLYNERANEVHNVRDVNQAVREAEIPQLSPLTGNVLEMLEGEKDKRSGFSATARGANQDVIAKQNSRDMINAMSNAGMRRPAQHFKVLLHQCMIPLFRAILDLGALHDKDNPVYPYGDASVTFKPGNLNANALMLNAATALTPQERAQQGDNLMAMHTIFMDPNNGMIEQYMPKNRERLIQRAMRLKGINDPWELLTSTDDPAYIAEQERKQQEAQQAQQLAERQQQQTEELQQTQLQIQSMVAQAEQMKAQAQQTKANYDYEIDQLNVRLEQLKLIIEESKVDVQADKNQGDFAIKQRELDDELTKHRTDTRVALRAQDTARIQAIGTVARRAIEAESSGDGPPPPTEGQTKTGSD